MNTTLSNLPDSWNEVDELICILRAWGISYLVGLDHSASASKIDKEVNQLLIQEEAKHHQLQVPLLLPLGQQQYGLALNMSMRSGVDKAAIESFLQQLGRAFRKPARLYLVGGATLVHLGVRPGFTQEVDIQVSGANEGGKS